MAMQIQVQFQKLCPFLLVPQFQQLGTMMVDHHTPQQPLLLDQTRVHRYSGYTAHQWLG
jgi:hypothetical protein